MSPRSNSDLSFSSTGELLTKKLRTHKDHNRLLDKYIKEEDIADQSKHEACCLLSSCPVRHSPKTKKFAVADE